MPSVLGVSVVRVKADLTQLRVNLAQAKTMTTATMAGISAGVMGSFKGIAAGIGIASVGLGVASLMKSTVRYEDQILKLAGTMRQFGKSSKIMDMLTGRIRELGQETVFTAGEVGEAMNNLALAGLTAAEQMSAIKPVLDGAAAGGISMARMSKSVAGSLRAFNLEASEAGRIVDILASSQTKTLTTMSELLDAMDSVGPIAAATGASYESVAAIIGTLSQTQLKGTQAATSLSIAMGRLAQRPKEVKVAMKELGISVSDIEDQFGNLKDPVEIFEKIAAAGPTLGQGLALFGARAKRFFGLINTIRNTTEGGTNFMRNLRDEISQDEGIAGKIAAKRMEGTTGKLKRLSSALQEMAISILPPVLDGIMALLAPIKELAKWISRINEASGGWIGTIIKWTVAVMGLVIAFVAAKAIIAFFITAVGAIGAAIGSAIGVIASIGSSIAGLIFSPFILLLPLVIAKILMIGAVLAVVVTAVSLVMARIIAFIKKVWDLGVIQAALTKSVLKWKQAWENVMAGVRALFDAFVEFVDAAVTRIANALGLSLDGWDDDLADTITSMINRITDFVLDATQWFRVLAENIDTVWQIVKLSVKIALQFISDNWRVALRNMIKIWRAEFAGLVVFTRSRLSDIMPMVAALFEVWLAQINLKKVVLNEAFFFIVNNWRRIFETVWAAIIDHLKFRINQMLEMINKLADAMAQVGEAIKKGLTEGFTKGSEAAKDAFNFLKDAIVGDETKEKTKKLVETQIQQERAAIEEQLAEAGIATPATSKDKIIAATKRLNNAIVAAAKVADPREALKAARDEFIASIARQGGLEGPNITPELQSLIDERTALVDGLIEKKLALVEKQRIERIPKPPPGPEEDKVVRTTTPPPNIVKSVRIEFEAAIVGIAEFQDLIQNKMIEAFNEGNGVDAQILNVNQRMEAGIERGNKLQEEGNKIKLGLAADPT